MGTITSSLIVSLIDKATAPARAVNAAIQRLNGAVKGNAAAMDAARGRMFDAAGAGFLLGKGLMAPIKAAMSFESAMADIRKVVEFETPQQFAELGQQIRAMSIRDLPIAADGIAAIIAAAGQSGVARQDLAAFAEMAAKVSVAWETSADDTGRVIAELQSALGLSIPKVGLLADAINHLGNNTAASAPRILDFTSRVAPMAKQFGLSTEQAAAFGAAMIGSGFGADVAATSFLNMGKALTKGSSATARQSDAMKAIGLNSGKVAKSMQKDAVGTIKQVMGAINKLPDYRRASVISDIFGDEARALGPLINDADLLAKVLKLVGDESNYAGSAQREFEERSKTTENALRLFKNRINDLGISIGAALLPPLNTLLEKIGPIVTGISDLAQRYPRLTQAIVGATAAVVGFRVATAAATWAGLFMKGGLLQAALAVTKFAGGVLNAGAATLVFGRRLVSMVSMAALAPVLGGLRAIRSAIIGYAAAASIAGHGGALAIMGKSLLGLLNPLNLVRGALTVLRVLLLGSGIGIAAAAIAGAGVWIYNNWKNLGEFFSGFADGFSKAFAGFGPALQPVVSGFRDLFSWVSNLLGPIEDTNGAFRSWGETVGGIVAGGVNSLIGNIERLVSAVKSSIEWMASLGKTIKDAMNWGGGDGVPKQAGRGTPAAVAGQTAKAEGTAAPAPTVTRARSPALAGARADGGPVAMGETYLVGEEGPELFTPGRSGAISPNDVYKKVAGKPPAPQRGVRQAVDDVYSEMEAQDVAGDPTQRNGQSPKPTNEGRPADIASASTAVEALALSVGALVAQLQADRSMQKKPASPVMLDLGGINMGSVVLSKKTDVDQVIERVLSEMDRRLRDAFDGLQTDQGWSVA